MTTVVNVRGGREFDVYVGRAVPRASDPRCRRRSIFANPYKVDEHAKSAEEAIELFEGWMRSRLLHGGAVDGVTPSGTRLPQNHADAAEWREWLLQLKGKALGCWCHPDPCHAQVLVRLIDELEAA